MGVRLATSARAPLRNRRRSGNWLDLLESPGKILLMRHAMKLLVSSSDPATIMAVTTARSSHFKPRFYPYRLTGARLSTCGKCWMRELGTLWNTSMITFWLTLKWLTDVRGQA